MSIMNNNTSKIKSKLENQKVKYKMNNKKCNNIGNNIIKFTNKQTKMRMFSIKKINKTKR